MYVSYFLDIASGASVVLLSATLFVATYAVTSLLRVLPHRHRETASQNAIRPDAPRDLVTRGEPFSPPRTT